MMAFYLFGVCVLLQVVFSFLYPGEQPAGPTPLYWSSPLEPLRRPGWKGLGNYKFLSVVLLVLMVLLFFIFR
jgi:SSS family solute:Na+ symporter